MIGQNIVEMFKSHQSVCRTSLRNYNIVKNDLTCLETVISSKDSYPKGLCFLSVLSKVIVTVALVTPACPPLYTSSCKLLART